MRHHEKKYLTIVRRPCGRGIRGRAFGRPPRTGAYRGPASPPRGTGATLPHAAVEEKRRVKCAWKSLKKALHARGRGHRHGRSCGRLGCLAVQCLAAAVVWHSLFAFVLASLSLRRRRLASPTTRRFWMRYISMRRASAFLASVTMRRRSIVMGRTTGPSSRSS